MIDPLEYEIMHDIIVDTHIKYFRFYDIFITFNLTFNLTF